MAVPLSELLTDAKDLADLLNNPIVADTTWRRWANQGQERLYRLVMPHAPERFHKSANFTLTGVGGNTVALAADFRRMRGAGVTYYPDSQSARRTLRRYDFGERDAQGGLGVGGWNGADLAYDVQGDSIVVEPASSCAGPYRYYYLAAPVKWSTTGSQDATNIMSALEPYVDFIAHWMAIKGAGKDESDTTSLREDFKAISEEILAEFSVSSDPATIQDVEATGGGRWR